MKKISLFLFTIFLFLSISCQRNYIESEKDNPGTIISVIEEDVTRNNADGTRKSNPVETYFKSLNNIINGKIPDPAEVIDTIGKAVDAQLNKDVNEKTISKVANDM